MDAPPAAPKPTCNCYEWWMVLLLRATAVTLWFAVAGLLMPASCMEKTHALLGLGPLKVGPMFEYLARSVSAFYMLGGGVLWIAASDPRRYATLLSFLIYAGTAFGVGITVVDLVAGLPLSWAVPEGVLTAGLGVVLWVLRAKAGLQGCCQETKGDDQG